MIANSMKAKLNSGDSVLGVSVMIPSPQLVEMIGRLGFDWVLLDCEHGTISLESLELMTMAAELTGMTPIVRPSTNSQEAILQAMDRGARGVQVPHVNTAMEARAAVEAVKYHPLGSRGLAAGTRGAGYGFDLSMSSYVEESNRQTLVCIQIEERLALSNLDEMLQVEGVDVFFLGPSDLSQSLGFPGLPDQPEVKAAMDKAFEKIVSAGKIAGSAAGLDKTERLVHQGVRYLYTHFTKLLATAGRDYLSTINT